MKKVLHNSHNVIVAISWKQMGSPQNIIVFSSLIPKVELHWIDEEKEKIPFHYFVKGVDDMNTVDRQLC